MPEFTNRQQEIIEAAIGIIAEKGIQFLTIKNLAKSINLTEGALYRHFSNKLEILNGILTLFKNRIEKNFHLSNSEEPPLDRLLNIISGQIDLFTEKPIITAVIFSEEIFQNDKFLADNVLSIMKNNLEVTANLIRAGQDCGQIREDIPTGQIANLVMGSVRLLVTRWRLSGYAFDLKKEGNNMINSLRTLLTK
ncbi:MAG: TetR/AcrR family transcriptional regulator [Candidatus Neomarinimicrobiota bacterium]|nr:MAG: TetR/AcrR family transcriptional regulator [Candidatus Neomarinimicrobiota bacterium]